MNITNRLCTYIKNNDVSNFLVSLDMVLKNQSNTIDFDIIDNALLNNKDFEYRPKLYYAYTFKRPLYNQLISDALKNSYNTPRNALYFIATREEKLRNRVLDILCSRVNTKEQSLEFKRYLVSHNLYSSYLEHLITSNNLSLKIHFVLYINYSSLPKLFTSSLSLAESILRCKALDNIYMGKSEALILLTKYTKDLETLSYIKSKLEKVVPKERQRYLDIHKEYVSLTGNTNPNEEQAIQDRTTEVLTYYKTQFQDNTGISMK